MTHIYLSKIIIIGSDNGLSLGRRQAIVWTSAGILLIEPLEINLSEVNTIPCTQIHLKCRLQNGVYFISASVS